MATKALNYTTTEINQRLNLAGTAVQPSDLNDYCTKSEVKNMIVVIDLSTKYSTSYANLSDALTALNADTSVIKIGGMNIKFINSTTNKYEQWNLKALSWSTNISDWALNVDGSVTNDKLKLPLELEKPSINKYVTQASEIGYGNNDVANALDEVQSTIFHAPQVINLTSDADLAIGDDKGYDILRIKDGDVHTKNFQSTHSPQAKIITTDADLAIGDGNGYDIFRIKEGYPQTKNFNGKQIKNALQNIIDGSGGSETIKHITVSNSDKIAIIGDSYTESSFSVEGKSYISKLSLFSDFNFVNFAKSGETYLGRIYALRHKDTAYGDIPLTEQGITYAMLCCYTNDIKYMSVNDYLNCLRLAIKVVKNIGAIPIICTEYHTGFDNSSITRVRSGMKSIANEYGLEFWDIAQIVDLIKGNNYAPFWSDSHPGTRTNAIESDNYQRFIDALHPMKSLKIFRCRKSSVSSLDELMFSSNYERAKLFKEINVGTKDLQNASNVDNCTSASTVTTNSEYQILQDGNALIMQKYSLVSAILPAIAKDIKYLALNIDTNAEISVYVKSSLASPYPTPQIFSSFYIDSSNAPEVGDVYLCEENNTNYTVQDHLIDKTGAYHLLCSPYQPAISTVGTLTKVSGSGANTIAYTYREVGYSSSVITDIGGHWVQATLNDGVVNISEHINEYVDVDKVHFLIVANGNSDIQINDISIDYKADINKTLPSIKPYEFKSNYYSTNEELLPSNTFSTVGQTDTNWNVIPIDIYEHSTNGTNAYPVGCSSAVKVTNETTLSCTISSSQLKKGTAILEIWARYFPTIYTNGADGQITTNSFDYNEIYVDIINSNTTLKDYVNTHWKIVRIPIEVAATNLDLNIYSNSKGIEIVYVSLKYKN